MIAFFAWFTSVAFGFTDVDLWQRVAKEKPCQSEEIIAHLPQDFRHHYVILGFSESLQRASPQSPRIILSQDQGEDYNTGSLFIAFQAFTDDDAPRFVEMIQFLPEEARYRFTEIEVRCGKHPHRLVDPPICATCHASEGASGAALEPIWPQYALWPGALPARDPHGSRSFAGPLGRKAFTTFEDTWKQHEAPVLGTPDAVQFTGQNPAVRLSGSLSKKNARTIARRIEETKHIDAYRPAVRAALADHRGNCSYPADFGELIPQPLREKFRVSFATILHETQEKARLAFDIKLEKASLLAGLDWGRLRSRNFLEEDLVTIARLRYLLERNGGSIASWFRGSKNDGFEHSFSAVGELARIYDGPCPSPGEISAPLGELLAKEEHPEASGLEDISPPSQIYESYFLGREHRDLLIAMRVAADVCSACHDHPRRSRMTPFIPFQDPTKFIVGLKKGPLHEAIRARVSLPAGADGAMPPHHPMRSSLRLRLLKALEALASIEKI